MTNQKESNNNIMLSNRDSALKLFNHNEEIITSINLIQKNTKEEKTNIDMLVKSNNQNKNNCIINKNDIILIEDNKLKPSINEKLH